MNLKKIILFLVIGMFGLGLCVSQTYAEDVIIIDPDPIDPIPEPPVPPPPPEPEPEPEEPQVNIDVDIDPDTLNLNANGKFITAYIELLDGLDVNDIASLSISAIDDTGIGLIDALDKPREVGDNDGDGIPDLMVKFDASEVRAVVAPADEVKITLTGLLSNGREFNCSDIIRVIGTGKSGEAANKFRFCFGKHLSAGAVIRKAVVWVRSGGNDNYKLSLKMHKSGEEWSTLLSKWNRYKYSKSAKGDGSEWDVTDEVIAIWEQGIKDLLVELEKQGCEKPLLIITYESFGAPSQEELLAASPRFTFNGSGKPKTITLFYDLSELQDVDEQHLMVYYWDEDAREWKPITDGQIDPQGQSITVATNGSLVYQIMGIEHSTDVPDSTPPEGTGSLGQNYPNPFNPGTTINYAVAKDCHVTLKIYSTIGALVATLVDEYKPTGNYSVYFGDGEELSRGIYYYQLVAGDFVATKRMVVLK
jgi:hypothetical protein